MKPKIVIPRVTILTLLDRGFQARRIANSLKVSLPTIRRICKELDLTERLKANGKAAQIEHNRTVRVIHGKRSRL